MNMRNGGIKAAIILVVAIAISTPPAAAQTVGPGPGGYFMRKISSPFQNITGAPGATPVLSNTANAAASVPIGFSFNFLGVDSTSVNIHTNGYLFLPGAQALAFREDWVTFDSSTAGEVWYQTSGAPGERRFTTQWNNLKGFSNSPSTVTFQAVFFEGSNDILYRYLDMESGSFHSTNAAIGYSAGSTLLWDRSTSPVGPGDGILVSKDPDAFSEGAAAVPEPGSTLLFLAALLAVVAAGRRRWV